MTDLGSIFAVVDILALDVMEVNYYFRQSNHRDLAKVFSQHSPAFTRLLFTVPILFSERGTLGKSANIILADGACRVMLVNESDLHTVLP